MNIILLDWTADLIQLTKIMYIICYRNVRGVSFIESFSKNKGKIQKLIWLFKTPSSREHLDYLVVLLNKNKDRLYIFTKFYER